MKKILVVDDSKFYVEWIKSTIGSVLKTWKIEFKVVPASDGLEGLEIIKNETFDCIFTDIEMPNMDGIEMTKLASEITDTPIHVFSDREDLEVEGAASVMSKKNVSGISDTVRNLFVKKRG